jgi:hypothetical protein
MKARSLIIVLLSGVCAAALWAVVAQARQVSELRLEKKRLENGNSKAVAPETVAIPSPTPEVPRELLQLRAEVARLSAEQRELAGARTENEKLRLQLQNRRANSAAGKGAGAAYLRTSEAKWVGYKTPEDTLQSLLWAAQNHNLEKFLEAVTPEAAKQFKDRIQQSDNPAGAAEEFFKGEGFPPGFQITGREQLADGTVALRVQIVPPADGTEPGVAVDSSEPLHFKQIAGQWKLGSPH